ncbi:MAG: ABC transporter permease [Desulfurococcales archaeon]|nr:ABC transporter permease [Desulfurococcales archaeon]
MRLTRPNPLRIYTYIIALLLYVPVIVMIAYSFNDSKFIGEWRGFTLKWYKVALGDNAFLETLYNSLTVAVSSAIVSIIIALPAALASRKDRLSLGLVEPLIYPPIVIPEIAEAVALMLFLISLGFPLGWLSVFIGHTAFNVAYAYITLAPSIGASRSLEEAARTLGAGPLTVFTKIILPLSMPGIIAALMLTFMLSFTDFIKTLFTTGPGFQTLPLLIWNRARRPGLTEYSSQNALNALASILIALSLSIALAYTAYMVKRLGRGNA